MRISDWSSDVCSSDLLGAWYAAKAVETAIAEVAHHLRREAIARGEISMSRKYRSYSAELLGSDFHDICGLPPSQPDIYRSDSYVASPTFGESVRSAGHSGIVFDTLRPQGGVNALCFLPPPLTTVMHITHFQHTVDPPSPTNNQ